MMDMVEMLGDSDPEFQTAIIFAYRVDLQLYDGLIRRVLNRSGVSNQVLFCDLSTYLEEIRLQQGLRFLGRHYSVTPVQQVGAFHPKIYLLLGTKSGRVLVGSGNATVGGLIRNAEVFGCFDFNRDRHAGPHPVFKQLAEFASELSQNAPVAAQRQVQQALLAASWLELPSVDDGRRVLIGGPGRQPLLEQILGQIASERIDGIVVCSSSFDRKLEGLKRLARRSKRPPICIVQPERVDLDGAEVKRLGDRVAWRSFVDPYPKEKKKRRDVYAHAKLLIFRHGQMETAVFGSSNASDPALFGSNTETIVVLPPRPHGQTAGRLGLDTSIKGVSILEKITEKKWPQDDSDAGVPATQCVLIGLSATEKGFRVTTCSGDPPARCKLAVAEQSVGSSAATLMIRREDHGWISEPFKSIESIRFGWLVAAGGTALSNPVAITWPEVYQARRGSSISAKVASGLLALHDGHIAGTILFELLDTIRDFEVMRVGSARATQASSNATAETASHQRSPEFFYTDAHPAEAESHQWQGDRLDLDILASLIQPLSESLRAKVDDDEEDFDDTKLGEEFERRRIDAQKGRITGAERDEVTKVTSQKLQRAIARLGRRLHRAADSIERSLEFLDKLKSIPPQAIARQIWMAQIGAFLCGRTVTADDGEKFTCLDFKAFAEYVIRITRALVGSRRGGFLDRLSAPLWKTSDGDMIKRGLAFLGTCVIWAVTHLNSEYAHSDPDGDESPESIACVLPELVAARFLYKIRRLAITCDQDDLERRFPAWRKVKAKRIAEPKYV